MRPYNVHIFTFGMGKGLLEPELSEADYVVDCSELRAPPKYMCQTSTGLNPETAEAFFSHVANQERCLAALRDIKALLKAKTNKREVLTVAVYCRAGMHRSVAMAEALAEHMRERWGVNVRGPAHYDLWSGLKRQRERLARRQSM
ncbi:hypothetical protein MMC12_006018 [Toensbergia leucococca]|nr:hypothetical protein [Toensbergia leucococca]